MIYLEALMLTIAFSVLIVSSVNDIKKGIIPNKILLAGLLSGIAFDVVYYIFFYQEGFANFIINLAVVTFLSLLFYFLNIWAAGDSKMLITVFAVIPSRLYSPMALNVLPCFVLIMCVFISAFVYVISDTVIKSIQEKRKLQIKRKKRITGKQILYIIVSYFFILLTMLLVNMLVSIILSIWDGGQAYITLMIDFVIALILIEVRKHISFKSTLVMIGVMTIALLIALFTGIYTISTVSFDFKPLIVVIITIILRLASEKYNYSEIPVSKLKPNMILSGVSVMQMNMSGNIENLPTAITEDRNARLSQEQIDAVIKWSETDTGTSSIMIVKKIPFAIFILIGTVLFLGTEAAFIWFA